MWDAHVTFSRLITLMLHGLAAHGILSFGRLEPPRTAARRRAARVQSLQPRRPLAPEAFDDRLCHDAVG